MIVSFDPSGYVIVAVPSAPTSTVVPSGNLSLFASSIAFLTAAFSSSVKLVLSATCVLAGTTGSVLSAVVGVFAVPAVDALPASSFAFALTSVPSLTLSAGTVITPVFGSTVTSDPSGTLHLPSSPFVAVTVFLFPSLSVYVTSTDFVSLSVGGVTVTLPSSFASTFGEFGAIVSLGFTFASFDALSPSFDTAFTSVTLFNLSDRMYTSPVVAFILIDESVPSGNVHLPLSSLVAVNDCGLLSSPKVISNVSALSSVGVINTPPSFKASNSGAFNFSTTLSACASVYTLPSFVITADPSSFITTSSFVKLRSRLAAMIAASTASCSGSVSLLMSTTSVF